SPPFLLRGSQAQYVIPRGVVSLQDGIRHAELPLVDVDLQDARLPEAGDQLREGDGDILRQRLDDGEPLRESLLLGHFAPPFRLGGWPATPAWSRSTSARECSATSRLTYSAIDSPV